MTGLRLLFLAAIIRDQGADSDVFRPVVRPAHALHEDYGLPSTPPSSVEEREFRHGRDDIRGRWERDGSRQSSPPRTPARSDHPQENEPYLNSSPPVPRTRPRTRHKRSHSCTTIGEHAATVSEHEFGKFQLRVDQFDGPTEEKTRPQTAGASETFHSLDVQIPHYNLGSPRFSPNGTPFLFGSSSLHVPSTQGELGSPSIISQHTDVRWLWPGADPRSATPSRLSPPMQSSSRSTMAVSEASPAGYASSTHIMSLLPSPPVRESSVQQSILSPTLRIPSFPASIIQPVIYDTLSFPPMSEHPSVVRYDVHQEIVAAVPARIVAQITSAAFVDYHLLSDFFLTYRLFMSCSHLSAYLIARLRWAIDRGDDTGKVVRVRTFVAIRHWLLNYFADDFVPSLLFRIEFADALNGLSNAVRNMGKASDLKIIGELKKCWRRTCTLYWDDEANTDLDADQDISPGGTPGLRKDAMRPQSTLVRIQRMTPPPRLESVGPDHSSGHGTFLRDVVEPLRIVKVERFEGTSSLGRSGSARARSIGSALSDQKFDPIPRITSPIRSDTAPIDSQRSTPPVSRGMTPVKRLRPGVHKRSGSFSDALRDNRQPLPLPNSLAKSTQLFMALPYAGSLVRGNLFPPTPAFVEVIAPATPLQEIQGLKLTGANSSDRSAAFLRTPDKIVLTGTKVQSQGVKKRLFGSVRRALSVKTPNSAGSTTNDRPIQATGNRIARSLSTRSNASITGQMTTSISRNGMDVFGEGQVARVDLLGAGAVAAFQRAMEEDIYSNGLDHTDRSAAVTSGYGSSHAGREGDAGMDGAMDDAMDNDIRIEVQEVLGESRQSSSVSESSKTVKKQGLGRAEIDIETRTEETEDFLHSPSTLNPQPDDDGFLSGEVSFLADKSEQTVSSRDSIQEEPPQITKPLSIVRTLSNASQFPRRSKSFSFERIPTRIGRPGIIDENLPGIAPEGAGRSLYSAHSFSLRRVTSNLSDYGALDNISEAFSDMSSIRGMAYNAPGPNKLLRRRPGGDLRAAVTVGDLDLHPRPKSDSSITTGAFSLEDAIRSPPYRRPASPMDWPISMESSRRPIAASVISLSAVATRRSEGLLLPPAPAPELPPSEQERPSSPEVDHKASFEAGVQKLRELEDDSDDGGIDVALAKLEGTYQRKKSGETSPMLSFHSNRDEGSRDFESSMVVVEQPEKRTSSYGGPYDGAHDVHDENDEPGEHIRRLKRRHKQVLDHAPLQTPPIIDGSKSKIALVREESEESLPILERGISINTFQMQPPPKALRKSPAVSNIRSSLPDSIRLPGAKSLPPSAIDLLRVDSELERHLSRRGTRRLTDTSKLSISSEISFEIVQTGSGSNSMSFPPINSSTIISELGLPSHPLRHPPSPPLTAERPFVLQSTGNGAPQTPRREPLTSSSKMGASPDATFTTDAHTAIRTGSREADQMSLQPTAIHLPFILAYDSELLARQFTLIEKDALLEVDWKELVELSWSQTDSGIKDWVELLNSKDIKGVEVVIARFNLVCSAVTVSWLLLTCVDVQVGAVGDCHDKEPGGASSDDS